MDSVKTKNPFLSLLKFYKKNISEQVSANCAFEPSCSMFSFQCIKNIGVFKGLLLTADRLSRCNDDAIRYSQYSIIDNNILDNYEMYH